MEREIVMTKVRIPLKNPQRREIPLMPEPPGTARPEVKPLPTVMPVKEPERILVPLK